MPKTFAQRVAEEQAALRRQSRSATSASRLQNASLDDTDLPVFDRDGRLKGTWGKQPDGSFGGLVRDSGQQPTPTPPDLTAKDLGALAVVWDGKTTDFPPALVHGHTEILFARSEDGSEPDISEYRKAPSTIRDREGGGTTVVCSPPGTWFVRLRLVGQDRVTRGEPSEASSVEIEAKVNRQDLIDAISEAQRLIDEAQADLALGEEERAAKISELESRQLELTENLAGGLTDVENRAEERAAELANNALAQAASSAQVEYDRLQDLADAARARAEEVSEDQATTAAEVATARQQATAAQEAADAAQAKADAVETAQNTTAAEAEAARQAAQAAQSAADAAQAKADAVETAQGSTAAAAQAARDAADAAQAAADAAQQKADALETAQGMTDAEVAAVKADAEAAQVAADLAQARADAAQAKADELGDLESGSILTFREEGISGDSYIRMPALPGMGSTGNPDHESATVTLEWWALWDGTIPHAQSGMVMTAPGPAHFELRSDTGQLRFRPGNVPSAGQVGSRITPNEWTHFAAVWDKPEREFRVYINGEHVETLDITETTSWGLASNWFVGYSTTGRTWNGRMRDVRVWNTARTAQQIDQGRYSTPKADDPELEGWWSNFVGGRLVDSSANRRDSTLTVGGARAVASASAEVIRVIQELREAERAAEDARLAAVAAQQAAGNAQSTADLALSSANAKNRIYSSTSAPSGTASNGDLWYRWSSTASDRRLLGIWVRESGAWRSMGTLDTTLIPLLDIGAGTFGDLSGDRLLAESVGVGVLDVVDIFGDSAVIAKIWTDIVRSRLVESVGIITEDMVATESVTTPKLKVTEDMVAKFAQILHLVADRVEMNSFIADSGMVGLLEAIGLTLSNEGAGTRFVVSGDGWRLEELDGTVLSSVGVGSPLTARGAEIEGVLTAKFADDSATRLTSGPVTYREGYNTGESWGLSYRNRTSSGPHQRFLREGVPENDSPAVVWDENGDLVLAPQQSAAGTGAIRVPGPLAVERLMVEGNSRVSGNFSALGSLGTYQSITFPNSYSANRPCFYRQIGNAILLSGAINSNVNGNFGGSMSQLPAPSTPMNLMGFRYNHSANQIAPMCLIVGVDGWLFAPNGHDISSNTPVSLDGLFYFI